MATPAAHDGLNGAVKAYIRRMLAECGAGMKALILDATTVRGAAARSGIVAAASPFVHSRVAADSFGGGCAPASLRYVHQYAGPYAARARFCPLPDGYRERGLLAVGDSSKRGTPSGALRAPPTRCRDMLRSCSTSARYVTPMRSPGVFG